MPPFIFPIGSEVTNAAVGPTPGNAAARPATHAGRRNASRVVTFVELRDRQRASATVSTPLCTETRGSSFWNRPERAPYQQPRRQPAARPTPRFLDDGTRVDRNAFLSGPHPGTARPLRAGPFQVRLAADARQAAAPDRRPRPGEYRPGATRKTAAPRPDRTVGALASGQPVVRHQAGFNSGTGGIG